MQYKNIELHGVQELSPVESGGMQLQRIPQAVRMHLSELGAGVATNSIGTELRLVPLEEEVQVTLSTVSPTGVDNAVVYYGGVQSGGGTLRLRITHTPQTFTLKPSPHLQELHTITAENRLPFSPQVIRVLFEGSPMILHDVKGAVRPPMPEEIPAEKMLFYGSSITHGSLACTPNLFWTRRCAAACGVDQENYGLAGSCRMEKEMVDWLASRNDWQYMMLEMGINVLGVYDEPQFRERVRYQLRTLHEAHPQKYLFCTDLFYCMDDLRQQERIHMYRRVVAEEIAAIGSDRVLHFAGRDLLTGSAGLSEDLVHPNIEGVIEIAAQLSARLRPYIVKP